jgi:acetyl-CoA carboxylase carboxyl transferase subunit beta
MPPDGWFRKKPKFPHLPASSSAAQVPDGVATKCARCGQILFTKDFEKNLKVCPHCGFHHKLTASERIAYTVDEGSWREFAQNLRSVDSLHFKDYASKLEKAQLTTGLTDGAVVGTATVDGVPLVLGVTDFHFVGGSMGSVAGEKFVRAVETAIDRRLPFVVFTASGGARMQEGLLSLMQMGKTAAACARLADARLPYIVVMTDPTMAGVLASYASLGDVHLAEPGATIGFAGARVSAQASGQKPPADYQTAEWQLAHGHIDQIVARRDIPNVLATLLRLLTAGPSDARVPLGLSITNQPARNGAHPLELSEAAVG